MGAIEQKEDFEFTKAMGWGTTCSHKDFQVPLLKFSTPKQCNDSVNRKIHMMLNISYSLDM